MPLAMQTPSPWGQTYVGCKINNQHQKEKRRYLKKTDDLKFLSSLHLNLFCISKETLSSSLKNTQYSPIVLDHFTFRHCSICLKQWTDIIITHLKKIDLSTFFQRLPSTTHQTTIRQVADEDFHHLLGEKRETSTNFITSNVSSRQVLALENQE